MIYYLFIIYLVSIAAACVKHPAGYANIISLFINIIIYLVFSACSGSMRWASCGSMIPPIIYYSLFINLLLCVCSGSMRQASCGLCQYFFFIHYLLFLSLFIYLFVM
jgi:hypothetical protein